MPVRMGVVAVVVSTVAAVASAQTPTPPGAAPLGLARDAWKRHDFRAAATHYQSALDAGGLSPTDVVDAYVHLGVSLTAVKKYTPAIAAFREAALIDQHFAVPRGAGPLAASMAERARKEKAKFGAIALTADAPSLVKSGQPFVVDASLDAAHLTMPATLSIAVKDSLSGAHFEDSQAPAPDVHFTVPTRMTLPGASLVVEVEALDAHDNRLATTQEHVSVETASAVVVASGVPRASRGSWPASEEDHKKSGGFWSTAWPYVIGGAALAAGGAAAWYFTRTPDDVTIDPARVQVR